jgi:hypothetical protein
MHNHSRPSTLCHPSRPTPITSLPPPPILIYTTPTLRHPQSSSDHRTDNTHPHRQRGHPPDPNSGLKPTFGNLKMDNCPHRGFCPFLGPKLGGAHPQLLEFWVRGNCPSTDTRIDTLGLSTFLGCRGHGGTLTRYPRQVESPRPPIQVYLLL